MGSFTICVALTWMVTTVLICSQAAPVTEFFGPPQTIEGDSNVEYPDSEQPKKVQEMERFHRTYKNGTVEFKMALSNGHVQYQRISSKIVDGDKVQVYEGYVSEQYKDGRYGTRYYAADENGYRSSSVIVENEPPQLPRSGPYSSNLPRDIQNELSPSTDDDSQTKPKTLIDNLIELEKDLEEEQISNLNLESNVENEIPAVTTESEILKHPEQEEILDNKSTEEPSAIQNSNEVQTDLLLNMDIPSQTELSSIENNHGKISEEPESSTLPASGENVSIDVAAESSTEQPISGVNNNADKFNESSSLTTLDNIPSSEEDLSGRSMHSSATSEILSEIDEDVKASKQPSLDVIEDRSTESISSGDIESNSGVATSSPGPKASNSEEITSEEPLVSNDDIIPNLEVSTEKSSDEDSEATPTETLLNDEVTSTKQPTPLITEVHEPNTGVPEIEEVKTDGETSKVLTYPLENVESTSTSTTISPIEVVLNNSDEIMKDITEQPSLDAIEDKSTESIASVDIESNSGLRTSSPADELLHSEEITSEEPLVSNEDIIAKQETNTDKASDEDSGATSTGTILNDDNTHLLTEQPTTFSIDALEPNTGVPELKEVKTHAETSDVSGYTMENAVSETTTLSTADDISKSSAEEEVLTEKTLLESIDGKPTESISPENESNSDLLTSSLAPEKEDKSTEMSELPTEKPNEIEISTDLPLEDSKEVLNESEDIDTSSEKKGRSLDLSTELSLAENNNSTATTVEGSGSEDGQNISDDSINTKVIEETTDKIDASITELPESKEEVSTLKTTSGEANNSNVTTEEEVLSTTQKNGLEAAGSSESSHDNTTEQDSQISTDQPLVMTSSEEISNEENKEKSTEDEASTELPGQSSDENDSMATIVELTTKAGNLSSTEESEEKTYGVEVELSLPVINF